MEVESSTISSCALTRISVYSLLCSTPRPHRERELARGTDQGREARVTSVRRPAPGAVAHERMQQLQASGMHALHLVGDERERLVVLEMRKQHLVQLADVLDARSDWRLSSVMAHLAVERVTTVLTRDARRLEPAGGSGGARRVAVSAGPGAGVAVGARGACGASRSPIAFARSPAGTRLVPASRPCAAPAQSACSAAAEGRQASVEQRVRIQQHRRRIGDPRDAERRPGSVPCSGGSTCSALE